MHLLLAKHTIFITEIFVSIITPSLTTIKIFINIHPKHFRQNSFSYDANPRINSRTFRKQKSPLRNRSPSLSPSRLAHSWKFDSNTKQMIFSVIKASNVIKIVMHRSAENSDETDLSHPPAEEFALRQANRWYSIDCQFMSMKRSLSLIKRM